MHRKRHYTDVQVDVQAFTAAQPGSPKVQYTLCRPSHFTRVVLKDTVILFRSPTFPAAQPRGGDPQAIIPTNAGAAPGGVPLSQRDPARA